MVSLLKEVITEPLLHCKWWSPLINIKTNLAKIRKAMPLNHQLRSITWLRLKTLNKFYNLNLFNRWIKNGWMIRNLEGESQVRIFVKMSKKLLYGRLQTIMRLEKLRRRRLIKSLRFKWRDPQQSGRLCIEINSESSQNRPTEMLLKARLWKEKVKIQWSITLFKMHKILNKLVKFNLMSMEKKNYRQWITLISQML